MEKADKDLLYRDVKYLTDIIPYRNYKNTDSLRSCSSYLKKSFEEKGYQCETQSWSAKNNLYENIIASYQKDKKKRLIVGAHYDVCGDQPGADDNASAVAGLLETARLFSLNQPKTDYRIDFVAYCLEEPPFYGTEYMGSYIHASSLYKERVDVIGMVCYEMIGYFSEEPNSQSFPSPDFAALYPSTADFIMVVGINECSEFNWQFYSKMKGAAAIDVEIVEFPDKHGLAGMSDQRNYWEFNYDALMINDTSFMRNPHYHEKSDTIETLNFEKMAAVVDSCYTALSSL